MSRPVATLVLLASLTFLLGLGRQAIPDFDDAYYAEAAREMVESGDWLTPHFNYEDRWEKPVLYYWLTAATFVVAGPAEWAARAWSAISGIGLVLLTWLIARHTGGNRHSSWLAGAIVATSYGYFALARASLPDLPLTFFVTLAIYATLRAVDEVSSETRTSITWWALAGFAGGLGFLTKGPVAIAVPAVVLLPIWWRERRTLHVPARGVLVALLVFAVVGLPWYAAMTYTHRGAYLRSFFLGDNLQRFATDRFNEPRPLWFYLPVVILGLMPWSAYLVTLAMSGLRETWRGQWRPSRDEWRLLLWAAVPLILFTVSIGKQPRYILPVLPPIAIFLARAMLTRVALADASPRGEGSALRVATWITAAVFVATALVLARAQPVFISAVPLLTWIAVIATALTGLALAAIAATARYRLVPPAMVAASVVLLFTVQYGALAGARPEPVEQMASLIRMHRVATEPVGELQVFVRNLVFYTGFKQVKLDDDSQAVAFMKSPERVLMAVRASDLGRLESLAGIPMHLLGQVDYLNAVTIKAGTLLQPDRSKDVETVLLVTNRP